MRGVCFLVGDQGTVSENPWWERAFDDSSEAESCRAVAHGSRQGCLLGSLLVTTPKGLRGAQCRWAYAQPSTAGSCDHVWSKTLTGPLLVPFATLYVHRAMRATKNKDPETSVSA